MHNIDNWSLWAKNNLDELTYLKEENRLLKENIEEIGKANESSDNLHRSLAPISLYVVILVVFHDFSWIREQFYEKSFFVRFIEHNIILFASFIIGFLFHITVHTVWTEIEKGKKKKGLKHNLKQSKIKIQTIKFIVFYIVFMLIVTLLGPQ